MRLPQAVVWSLAAAVVILGAGVAALVKLWPHAPRGVAPELVPASWAEYRTSPGHESHVGRGKAQCRDCHDFEREGFRTPRIEVCKNCHTKESSLSHHGSQGSGATGCLTCHVFAPGRAPATCIGCHAKSQGILLGVVDHATTECTKCHRPHDAPSIVPADCGSCHDERAMKHGDHAGSKGCLDCHRAHQPASAAKDTCSSCHSEPAGPHPAGHESCIGCHQPHDFVAGGQQACIRCHGAKTTLTAGLSPAHDICTNCHTPHAPADAAGACAGCHKDVHVEHGGRGDCVGCHAPHGESSQGVARACTGCHAKVAASDTGAHAGGIACEKCHKPHVFPVPGERTLCADCHATEIASATSNKGHSDCAACHGSSLPHAPAKAAPCGSCHAAELQMAHVGHRTCESCHEPHSGHVTTTCAKCHGGKTGGPHATIPGGCEKCHQPHGPGGVATPPGCQTCHPSATLPALHSAPGHAACGTCHVSSHEPPRADRATCTGNCHADKRGHQPGAPTCDGCHVFRR